jgi:hypothetical protein
MVARRQKRPRLVHKRLHFLPILIDDRGTSHFYFLYHFCGGRFVISPLRLKRRLRDRAISIGLAVSIGVIVGVGAWVASDRFMGMGERNTRDTVAASTVPQKQAIPKHAAGVVAPGEIVPHKALYDVTLASARSGSQIINIQGRMYYQLHKGCDGYTTDHRFALTYSYADSEPMRVTSDFSTLETFDGQAFDFSSRRRRAGELYQELRGHAERNQGEIVYQEPLDLEQPLPKDAMFPVAHTRALLNAARTGNKFYASTVFDGSDQEGPVDVAAVIGTARQSARAMEKLRADLAAVRMGTGGDDLLAVQAYTMRLAFFPRAGGGATSDYELTMQLHDNGIISHMTIAYPDFTVDQKLVALEPVAPESCDGGKKPIIKEKDLGGTAARVPSAIDVPDLPLR